MCLTMGPKICHRAPCTDTTELGTTATDAGCVNILLLIVWGKRLYSKAGTQIYVPGRACVRTYVRVSEFTSLCAIRLRWYCALFY